MSKLLKEQWNKLAFGKGNQSINESMGEPSEEALVALENEWWELCDDGRAETYSMEEMAEIEDQINATKDAMGLPKHKQCYAWATDGVSPPIHPTELRNRLAQNPDPEYDCNPIYGC